MDQNCRMAVVGAGAIGGVTAAFLRQAGWNPEVVCRHKDTVDKARSGDFHVFGLKGDLRVGLDGVRSTAVKVKK